MMTYLYEKLMSMLTKAQVPHHLTEGYLKQHILVCNVASSIFNVPCRPCALTSLQSNMGFDMG